MLLRVWGWLKLKETRASERERENDDEVFVKIENKAKNYFSHRARSAGSVRKKRRFRIIKSKDSHSPSQRSWLGEREKGKETNSALNYPR